MTPHLWSGRFDSAPDPAAFDFGVSFPFDRRLFEDDVTGSLAWADALVACGALTRDDGDRIRDGLTTILEHGRREPAWVGGPDEDVHSFVERQLVERIGDAGRRLHTGRSRNEQVSLDLRLYLRRRIPLLQQRIRQLVETLPQAWDFVAKKQYSPLLRSAGTVFVAAFGFVLAFFALEERAPAAWSTAGRTARS